MTDFGIPVGMRAALDRELQSAVDALVCQAATFDGADLIEANVELTNYLLENLSTTQLAAAAAALALRVHLRGGEGGTDG